MITYPDITLILLDKLTLPVFGIPFLGFLILALAFLIGRMSSKNMITANRRAFLLSALVLLFLPSKDLAFYMKPLEFNFQSFISIFAGAGILLAAVMVIIYYD